jgi:hypothetical protein
MWEGSEISAGGLISTKGGICGRQCRGLASRLGRDADDDAVASKRERVKIWVGVSCAFSGLYDCRVRVCAVADSKTRSSTRRCT